MKLEGTALNPKAAAYVPVSKRDGDSANYHVQHQPYGYGVQRKGSYPCSQMYMPKTETASEKQMSDEDMEMDIDIDFLLATFSNLSYESISDVYLANNHDLDATIEMLNQLEIFSNEAEEYLPDTLNIGDVPETIEFSTSSAPKQKNESTEASASPNAPVSSS